MPLPTKYQQILLSNIQNNFNPEVDLEEIINSYAFENIPTELIEDCYEFLIEKNIYQP